MYVLHTLKRCNWSEFEITPASFDRCIEKPVLCMSSEDAIGLKIEFLRCMHPHLLRSVVYIYLQYIHYYNMWANLTRGPGVAAGTNPWGAYKQANYIYIYIYSRNLAVHIYIYIYLACILRAEHLLRTLISRVFDRK